MEYFFIQDTSDGGGEGEGKEGACYETGMKEDNENTKSSPTSACGLGSC